MDRAEIIGLYQQANRFAFTCAGPIYDFVRFGVSHFKVNLMQSENVIVSTNADPDRLIIQLTRLVARIGQVNHNMAELEGYRKSLQAEYSAVVNQLRLEAPDMAIPDSEDLDKAIGDK